MVSLLLSIFFFLLVLSVASLSTNEYLVQLKFPDVHLTIVYLELLANNTSIHVIQVSLNLYRDKFAYREICQVCHVNSRNAQHHSKFVGISIRNVHSLKPKCDYSMSCINSQIL